MANNHLGYAELVKQNQKKALAKRFKTTPGNISDKDIEGIRKDDQKKGIKRGVGGASIGAGANLAVKTHKSGKLDGVKKMTHITGADAVDKIKREGLKGTKIDESNLTMNALQHHVRTGKIKADDLKDKVYLANNKGTEIGIKTGRMMNGMGGKTGKVKVNMPLKHLKKVERDNPELMGAKNAKDFVKKHSDLVDEVRKTNPFMQKASPQQLKQIYKSLGREGTTTVQGTVGTKYIKGSKDYQKNTAKNVINHIKENPKMFAKGVGQAGVAGALLAGGGKLMYDGIKKSKLEDIRSKQEKKAQYLESIYEVAMEKTASAKDDKSRDGDTNTRMWRDRLKPELKRGIKSLPATMGGALVGGTVGGLTGNPRNAAIGSMIGGSAGELSSRSKQTKKDLDKLSNRYLGHGATKEMKTQLSARNGAATAMNTAAQLTGRAGLSTGTTIGMLASTPEAMIQKARREKASKKKK